MADDPDVSASELKAAWTWIYGACLLTFGIGGVMWRYVDSQTSGIEARMLGLQTRLEAQLGQAELQQRQDREKILDKLDRTTERIEGLYRLLLEQERGKR